MAEILLNSRVQNKRDNNLNWEQNNPVLLNGEIIIVDHEIEGLKIKIGDGINNYSQLPYFGTIYAEKPIYSYTEIQGLEQVLEELENKIQLIPIIPSGMIMIWSGNVNDIPDGWALCDGQNGTPDLTDKFVLGAGNNYTPGNVGGEESVTLTSDQMPAHTHSFLHNAVTTDTNGSNFISNSNKWGGYNATVINSTESAGNNQSHNNMPPYYALCYIMKI